MDWKFECQTCMHSKCVGYGMHFACDKSACTYTPYPKKCSNCAENPPREGSFASKLYEVIKKNEFDRR